MTFINDNEGKILKEKLSSLFSHAPSYNDRNVVTYELHSCEVFMAKLLTQSPLVCRKKFHYIKHPHKTSPCIPTMIMVRCYPSLINDSKKVHRPKNILRNEIHTLLYCKKHPGLYFYSLVKYLIWKFYFDYIR